MLLCRLSVTIASCIYKCFICLQPLRKLFKLLLCLIFIQPINTIKFIKNLTKFCHFWFRFSFRSPNRYWFYFCIRIFQLNSLFFFLYDAILIEVNGVN